MQQLAPDIVERVLSRHPVPIADAVGALTATDSPHERRDRVVEVFRSVVRTLGILSLAARIQFGAGPGGDTEDVPDMLRTLRRQGLTDGRWIGLSRELLRPWKDSRGAHPTPELVALFHDDKGWRRTLEGLLKMRRAETIAHGSTGNRAELADLLARRIPELERLLMAVDPLWERLRLVVPVAPEEGAGPQRARLLMGDTPGRGLWRRIPLAPGVELPADEAALVDGEGRPVLALSPVLRLLPPTPGAVEEVFLLDGSHRSRALYVAFPSMDEHREAGVWEALGPTLLNQEDEEDPEQLGEVARPYRGLESFGPEHASLFFGREQRAEALANRIRRRPMVTVTGPSGSGKSSLLKAGVLPQLEGWAVATLRPGTDPMAALTLRVSEACWGSDAPRVGAGPGALRGAVRLWCLDEGRRLLVLVDQAEELFTLCPDPAQRLAFAAALASLASDERSPARVVLSVREDFFSRFATLAPLAGLYSREVEVVTTPDRDALLRTVILPAQRFGYAFEDQAMAQAMVDAVEGEPAALTLLQFCADRLWEARDRTWKRLTVGAYEAMGGVAGALATHAEAVLAELTPSQQQVASALLLRLVTTEETRAVVSQAELLEVAPDREDAEQVLARFIDARLLISRESEVGGGEAVVELTHEALIRHWARLQGWLSEDREGRRLLEALRQAARGWDERRRPAGLLWRGEALEDYRTWRRHSPARLTELEAAFIAASDADARRRRRLFRGLGAAAFTFLVITSATMFGLWRDARATERAAIRQVSRLLATAAQREVREGDPVLGVLLASEARQVTGEAGLSTLAVARDALLEALSLSGGVQLRPSGEAITGLAFEGPRLIWTTADERMWLELADPSTVHVEPRGAGGGGALPLSLEARAAGPWRLALGREDGSLALTGDVGPGAVDTVVFRSHEASPVAGIALTGDGAALASAWADGSLWLWAPAPWQAAGALCQGVARNMTESEWRQYFPGKSMRSTCSLDPAAPTLKAGEGLLLVTVEGRGEGALRVWLDGVRASLVGDRYLAVPGGAHHLRVAGAGCAVAEAWFHLWPGGQRQLSLSLGCDGFGAPPAEPVWIPAEGGPLAFSSLEEDPAARHLLHVPPFEILMTPVTVDQYRACVEAGVCAPPPESVFDNARCAWTVPGRGDHPMNCVAWRDAQTYCESLDAQLPSGAQWEWAAEWGGDRPWPWGDEPADCTRAVMDDGRGEGCGAGRTWAVCSMGAGRGPGGICDLIGQVYEWLADCTHRHSAWADAPSDGSPWVEGCTDRETRVLRGGAYPDLAWKVARSLNNVQQNQRFFNSATGFRCVRPLRADRSRSLTSP